MIIAILLDAQPPDFWHDPAFQFIINAAIAVFAIVITSIVSIWIYKRQRQKKEISYEIVSDAPVISISKSVASRVEIKLDGNPVKAVTLAVIKVSNTGNTAVKKDDYDEPLQFLFKGRKVINSEVIETEPKDLIDQVAYKTFIPQPTQQEHIEFPKFLLNPKQSITFSALLEGAKDKISKKGRIIDGNIVQFDLKPQIKIRELILPISSAFLFELLFIISFSFRDSLVATAFLSIISILIIYPVTRIYIISRRFTRLYKYIQ